MHLSNDLEYNGDADRNVEACIAGIGSRYAYCADNALHPKGDDGLVGYVQDDVLQHANNPFATEFIIILIGKDDVHRDFHDPSDPGEILSFGKTLDGQVSDFPFGAAAAAADKLEGWYWFHACRFDMAQTNGHILQALLLYTGIIDFVDLNTDTFNQPAGCISANGPRTNLGIRVLQGIKGHVFPSLIRFDTTFRNSISIL